MYWEFPGKQNWCRVDNPHEIKNSFLSFSDPFGSTSGSTNIGGLSCSAWCSYQPLLSTWRANLLWLEKKWPRYSAVGTSSCVMLFYHYMVRLNSTWPYLILVPGTFGLECFHFTQLFVLAQWVWNLNRGNTKVPDTIHNGKPKMASRVKPYHALETGL